MSKTIQLSDGTDNLLPVCAESGDGYVKFADGTMICWGQQILSFTQDTPYSSYVARLSSNQNINFARSFISRPSVTATIDGSTLINASICALEYDLSKITFCGILSFDGATEANGILSYTAIGRWK